MPGRRPLQVNKMRVGIADLWRVIEASSPNAVVCCLEILATWRVVAAEASRMALFVATRERTRRGIDEDPRRKL